MSSQASPPAKVPPGVALRRGGLRPGRVGRVVRVLSVLRHRRRPGEATDRRGGAGTRRQTLRAEGREEDVLSRTVPLTTTAIQDVEIFLEGGELV